MAMISCPECNANVSDIAFSCPQCGFPINTSASVTGDIKLRYVAALCGILLGSFGMHRFYLDKHVSGILYAIFFWTGIPALLGIIEGILYLAMTEADFQKLYSLKV